jgi:Flp pilus assembly protein TadB
MRPVPEAFLTGRRRHQTFARVAGARHNQHVFFFWVTVRDGPLAGLVAVLAYAVLTVLLVGSFNIAPWLVPFVIIPACVIPVVLIGRREMRRERQAQAGTKNRHPA